MHLITNRGGTVPQYYILIAKFRQINEIGSQSSPPLRRVVLKRKSPLKVSSQTRKNQKPVIEKLPFITFKD